MYKEIGKKIKYLAKGMFYIELLASIIGGIILMQKNGYMILVGLFIIIFGSITAIVSSWLIFSLGELVDKTCDIEHYLCDIKKKYIPQLNDDQERINKIKRLYSQGLITEEEYRNKISQGQEKV